MTIEARTVGESGVGTWFLELARLVGMAAEAEMIAALDQERLRDVAMGAMATGALLYEGSVHHGLVALLLHLAMTRDAEIDDGLGQESGARGSVRGVTIETFAFHDGSVRLDHSGCSRLVTRQTEFVRAFCHQSERCLATGLEVTAATLTVDHRGVGRHREEPLGVRGVRIVTRTAIGDAHGVTAMSSAEAGVVGVAAVAEFDGLHLQESFERTAVRDMARTAALLQRLVDVGPAERRRIMTREARLRWIGQQEAGVGAPVRVVATQAVSLGRRRVDDGRVEPESGRIVTAEAELRALFLQSECADQTVGFVATRTITLSERRVEVPLLLLVHVVATHTVATRPETGAAFELRLSIGADGHDESHEHQDQGDPSPTEPSPVPRWRPHQDSAWKYRRICSS